MKKLFIVAIMCLGLTSCITVYTNSQNGSYIGGKSTTEQKASGSANNYNGEKTEKAPMLKLEKVQTTEKK